jgi:hypothetical protein
VLEESLSAAAGALAVRPQKVVGIMSVGRAVYPIVQLAPARTGIDLARVLTLHPRHYTEVRAIGEAFLDGSPVIIDLTGMEDSDAQRVIDFAAGLIFGSRGSIERVSNKVFLLSPADPAEPDVPWREPDVPWRESDVPSGEPNVPSGEPNVPSGEADVPSGEAVAVHDVHEREVQA